MLFSLCQSRNHTHIVASPHDTVQSLHPLICPLLAATVGHKSSKQLKRETIEELASRDSTPKKAGDGRGTLLFDNVSMRYRPTANLALNGVNLEISHGEKVRRLFRMASAYFVILPSVSGGVCKLVYVHDILWRLHIMRIASQKQTGGMHCSGLTSQYHARDDVSSSFIGLIHDCVILALRAGGCCGPHRQRQVHAAARALPHV